MRREWKLSNGRRLVATVGEGEQDFDFVAKCWVDVVWMLVMWFPPSDRPGAVETGQCIGGQTRREAFGKMRRMLATQPPPSVCFVPRDTLDPKEESGVWQRTPRTG